MNFFLQTLILLIVSYLSLSADSTNQLEFSLVVDEKEPRLMKVEGKFSVDTPFLTMDQWGVPGSLPKGWATFVEIISIKNSDGSKIEFNWLKAERKWKLEVNPGTKISIKYTVNLEHDSHNWDSVGGPDGRPMVFDKTSLFWITKGIFIYPADTENDTQSIIEISVPQKWKIGTPWTILNVNRFKSSNLSSTINNILVLGNFKSEKILIDEMEVEIIGTKEIAHRNPLFANTLDKVLPVFRDVFHELPKTKYLIFASKYFYEDGEAFSNSFHQMFVDKELEHRKVVWANVLAHEMFHYWNGTNNILRGTDPVGNFWFSEGFTEYYANLSLVRAGLISRNQFLQKLAFQFSRFLSSQRFSCGQQPNLLEAGTEKSKNWPLIYGGGSSIAFITDIYLREASDGQKSLDDLMKKLYENYGKRDQAFTHDQLLKEINGITKKDFTSFFNKYVSGTEFNLIPILNACEKAGLIVSEYQGEFYLKIDPSKESSHFLNLINQE